MARADHQLEIDIAIEHVWSFVSNIDNWAPLVPGYVDHKVLHDGQSTWKFKGDVGNVRKTIRLKLDITEWRKPTRIAFVLTGLNDSVKGDGYFEAKTVSNETTKITGHMNMNAKGMLRPVVNPVLKSLIPKTTRELTEAIGTKVTEFRRLPT